MLRIFLSLAAGCWLCFHPLIGRSDRTDFQIWTRTDLGLKVCDDKTFYVFHGLRFNENASQLFFQFIEVGMVFRVSDSLRVIPSYRESVTKRDGEWLPEENPRFTVTKTWKTGRFRLGNRARVEYRSRRDNFLYRNQFILIFPPIYKDKVIPYLKDEIFLDKFKNFRRNRLRGGFEFILSDIFLINADFTFQWRKTGSGAWNRDDVLRGNFDFEF